ncbi:MULTISPECIES: hypothetical protein [unclassified Methylobacterium]|uniref:hypothetical protein n=1 Tax=unclassified Methylobacterium TaxID=2615210 RepID=UPI001FB96686|nr:MULTISPECIES: hypothetical protein [unclassified Methylobacterium]MCJ2093951.1 hypothetical protein [Methylobacterium sp. J-072]MCJ2142931.1 hypothetical protein [Methylobacterium sp. E-066]
MIEAARPAIPHDTTADLSGLTDLEMRTLACRTELATLFRAIQGIAGLAASNLENGGPIPDLCGLFSALGQLDRQASNEAERYGALLSSAGSA